MFINKKLKLFIYTVISSLCVFGISFYVYNSWKPKIEKTNNLEKDFYVSIDGAVKDPGTYKFKSPKTLREVIFVANILTSADISILDLDRIIDSDYEVTIPYKVDSINKIKWKDLYSVEQLTNLGVKNSVAQTIITHRRQHERTTWEQILALKGIGQVTLAQLKELIELS